MGMSLFEDNDVEVTERLLPSSAELPKPSLSYRAPNPLPSGQLLIVLLNRFCDALSATSTEPYISQLISELDIVDGDQKKVGYYVGLLGTVSQAAATVSIFQWNRLSDRIGRKPVLIIGMLGAALSQLCFGLSRTFSTLLASTCLWAVMDGNVGVTKSIMGEITDSTNRARGFALIFVIWAIGGTVGPLIGGNLEKPSDHFPGLFSGHFWRQKPYFLPSLVVSIVIILSVLIVVVFFEESSRSFHRRQPWEETTLVSREEKLLPLRQVLTYPVVIAVSNYTALSFMATALGSLFPVYFAIPVEIGGLGFDPSRIGFIMGAYRAFDATILATAFPWIVRRLGERRVVLWAIWTFPTLWTLLPIVNMCARLFGNNIVVWMCIASMAIPLTCMDMAFSCIFVFVTSAAPSRRSLGATNGILQTSASIARSIAPAAAASLFSFSVQHNILGGYAVYVIFFIFSCFLVLLALRLPHNPRPEWEEGEVEDGTAIDLREIDNHIHNCP